MVAMGRSSWCSTPADRIMHGLLPRSSVSAMAVLRTACSRRYALAGWWLSGWALLIFDHHFRTTIGVIRPTGTVPRSGSIHSRNRPRYISAVLSASGVMQVYDALQGKWKTNVTALSPKWAVGNVLGNAMMAMVHAGTNPLQVLREINKMREEAGG